ncbi:MAG: hypothetical protein HY927_13475 [Elusimicrobia bacterium]|nr:hypothetical protein [Elusimicrobiota bacterium]
MDAHNRWLADFKKEVDEVLDMLRASKAHSANHERSTADGLSGQFEDLKTAKVEFARLEFLVEDLQSKLSSRTIQFESEQKSRDRLKDKVQELTAQVRALEEKAAAFRRESLVHSEEAKELDETLRVTMQARSQLVAALDDEKRQAESWMEESRTAKSKLDSMESLLTDKETALQQAQKRYENACKTFTEETAELHRETHRLSQEVEKARLHEAEVEGRVDLQRRALELERERLQAESARSVEKAESSRKTAEEALAEAHRLRDKFEAEAREARKALESEREHFRQESEKYRANVEESYARLEDEHRELEAERHRIHTDDIKVVEDSQSLRQQGMAALEDAKALKAQLEAERDRLHHEVRAEKERSEQVKADAESTLKRALEMEKELLRKGEDELSAAKSQIELERNELLAEFEAERARIRRQAADEVEVQRAVIRAELAEEFRLHRLHAEEGLRREQILKGVDPESHPRLPHPASPGLVAQAQAAPSHEGLGGAAAHETAPSGDARAAGEPAGGVLGVLRRWGLVAAGFAVLAVLGVGLMLQRDATASHPVPFSHPTGMVWKQGELWVSDWFEQSVFRMKLENGTFEVLNQYKVPGSHFTGMAVAEGAVYVADSWKKDITLLRVKGEKLVPEKSWPSPGPNPSALAIEGKYLYSADSSSRRIYKHSIDDDLAVLESSKVGFSPVAVLPADDFLWTADGDTAQVFSLRLNKDLTPEGVWSLPALEAGREPLSCVTRVGRTFWFGRDGSKVLLEAPRRSLRRKPL